MYLDPPRTDWVQIALMVYYSLIMLTIVDVCVVTTTKDMDDTCMLANILDESISPCNYLTIDHFDKVVCVAAAKVPVVKIWDAELYYPLQSILQ
jgi:DNA polymerase sigma